MSVVAAEVANTHGALREVELALHSVPNDTRFSKCSIFNFYLSTFNLFYAKYILCKPGILVLYVESGLLQ
jgi:hypothetical protein